MAKVWDQPIPEDSHMSSFKIVGESYGLLGGHKPSLYEAESIAALATFNQRNLVWSSLSKIGLADYLQLDHRPTFVIDLSQEDRPKKLAPSYLNPALLHQTSILDQICGRFCTNDPGLSPWQAYSDFQKWVYGLVPDGAAASSFLYKGYIWAATTVESRWRIVSGTSYNDLYNREDEKSKVRRSSVASAGSRDRLLTPILSERMSNSSTPDPVQPQRPLPHSNNPVTEQPHSLPAVPEGSFDWTHQDPGELSDHLSLVRNVDWSSTPLGSIESWSPQLRVAANLVMTDPCPAALFWGEDCIVMYNEPYAPILEAYHPWCLGTSVFDSLKEYNDHLIPVLNSVRQTGEAIHQRDLPLFLYRSGALEEAWFSLSFHPILGETGQVEGVFEQIRETTGLKIVQRRLGTLLDLGARITVARHLRDLWEFAFEALEKNERDVPFALLYSIEDENMKPNHTSSCSKARTEGKRAMLQASIGVPEGHQVAPVCLCLENGTKGFMPWFRQSIKSRKMVVLDVADGTLPAEMLNGIEPRAFGEPCRTVAISPIMPTSGDHILGFYVAGINPRRPFDEGYRKFVTACTRLLATSMASVVLLEEEVGRRKVLVEESAHVQAELSQQLEVKQQRIELQERRFQRLAQKADIGIFIVNPNGEYSYRNQRWFDIFCIAKDTKNIEAAWAQLVAPGDIATCRSQWRKLTIEKKPISYELKLNCKWSPPTEDVESKVEEDDRKTWVVISAYPEVNEDGTIEECVGIVMDISSQKWAQRVQRQRTQDALESKRALENFIDTTSHEMRNPLSAITQTADGLLGSALSILATYSSVEDIPKERKALLQVVIESAQTIIQCSNHQKRIVDDVLTMSKLDSNFLSIHPVESQPEYEIRYALKVFESEAREGKISVEYNVEDSYKDLGVDWVMLDPTRMNQVFVNLITNAIKFTRLENRRSITVSIGASEQAPRQAYGVQYFENATGVSDPTSGPEWGSGSPVYITVTVKDTGRGLTMEDQELLFMRFSEASPKTHVHYGGSGLGLYISRRLAEMQGGGIGFVSTFSEGSTFSFFVKGRRSLNTSPKSRLPAVGEMDLNNEETLAKVPSLLRRTSSDPENGESKLPMASAASKATAASPTTTNVIHILVVEDNLVNQKVLAKQLRNLGCVVDVANHGVEALSHIEKTRFWTPAEQASNTDNQNTETPSSSSSDPTPNPDPTAKKHLTVVLMDWEMPVMDGLTCVRRIRALQQQGAIAGHVPVIAVTANVRHEQVELAMQAGMDDVVGKPFRVPDLMTKMKALLEKMTDAAAGPAA